MLKFNHGIDIVQAIGQITGTDAALQLLKERLEPEQFNRLQHISHPEVIGKIANAVVMCDPDRVFVNPGSEADRRIIRA